jgi:integrase
MSRRQGHLRQRGPGVFEIRWRVSGVLKTETFKGTRRDAEKRLRALHDLAERGFAPSRDTLAAWLDEWLLAIRREVSPLTLRHYRSATERIFKPLLGHIRLSELDRTAVRKAWADLAERLASSTVRSMHRILSAALSYAVEAEKLQNNPCSGWRKGRGLPKLPNQETPALNSQAVTKLIDAARDHPIFAPTVIAAGTGARRSEISALRWSDVDMTTGVVTISKALKQLSAANIITGTPKGGKARRVRLPTSHLALLLEWRRLQAERLLALGYRIGPDDFICTNAVGERMTPNRITEQFRNLARRCGIEATFHSLRHTHASLLLRAGESVKTVQLRLGHSVPSTTLNTYAHAIPDDGDGEGDRLDAALSGRPKREPQG